MSKPQRVLDQYVKFKGMLNKYTGRALLRPHLGPLTRLAISPSTVLLRTLGL